MERKLLFILLLFLQNLAFSQKVKFHHFTDEEKFGLGNVWAVIEDTEGFIWLGTKDGLYKYDGYDINTYRYNKNDTNSLAGNFVITLFEDSNQNLWVGTYGDGLSLYNREKNNFQNFRHDPNDKTSLPNDRVKSIVESADGTIYVGTEGGGIGIIRPTDQSGFSHVKFDVIHNNPSDKSSLSSDYVRSIVINKTGLIYIATSSGGLNIYDPKSGTVISKRENPNDPHAIPSDKLGRLFIDSRERMWVGTLDMGLALYDEKNDRYIRYTADITSATLNDNEVESILEDKEGNIWVGTDNGLSRLVNSKPDIPRNQFINYLHEPLDPFSILSNSVKILYIDKRDAMWVGTYFGGINIHDPSLFKFNAIRQKPWLENSLTHNNVTAFEEDNYGNIWIGTDGGGVNLLRNGINDLYNDNYEYIKIVNPYTNKEETKVKAMDFDQNGNLWIGFWSGGLFKYNPSSKKSSYFGQADERPSNFLASNVLEIKVDKNNNVWAGSYSKGIHVIKNGSDSIKTYLPKPSRLDSNSSERIRTMLIDSKDRIWAGGDLNDLFLFDPDKDEFRPIKYGKSIIITSLMEGHNGLIWIGTVSSGLISYNPENQLFKSYSEDNGLPGSSIQAMRQDDNHKLWVSTSDGMIVFNAEDGTHITYSKADGLQGNHFNKGSSLLCSNGLMLFGGVTGWNGFDPKNIKTDNSKPKIAFTNFWLNDELMNVDIPGSPLLANINSNTPVNLSADQNSFSIEFSALEYDFNDNNQYQYLLEGFNQDWQSLGNDRKAIFTNLNPKTYRLRVKATNHDGIWQERKEYLLITIHPAWWQTPIFKFAAIFLLIFFAWSVYRLRMKILINQSRKLEEEVQLRTKELKTKNLEMDAKNNEIQSQNEELIAQHEQIVAQKNKLEDTQQELKEINEKLERIVDSRTKKLKSTIKQLDKTVRELDRFVYSASHDLSAPLKSIRGLIQIAKLKDDPKSAHECLDYMDNSVNRLEDVIQSLVEYSRNSHLEVNIEPISVNEMIEEVINELAYWPEAKKIDIQNNLDKDLVIHSDKGRLKIVLHNLVSNGIKYSDFHKHERFIRIESIFNNDSSWTLKLQDNGIGIDDIHVKSIFNMYFRASEQSDGSGLGLFIVSEIIYKLGGKIFVESEKGKGTTFSIELPVIQKHPSLAKVNM